MVEGPGRSVALTGLSMFGFSADIVSILYTLSSGHTTKKKDRNHYNNTYVGKFSHVQWNILYSPDQGNEKRFLFTGFGEIKRILDYCGYQCFLFG